MNIDLQTNRQESNEKHGVAHPNKLSLSMSPRLRTLLEEYSIKEKKSSEEDAVVQKRLLTEKELVSLLSFEKDLGVDPSSEYFTKRTKSIAFMVNLNGSWFQLNHNFFNQNADYNDFSGGYKRFYDTLSPEFVRNPGSVKLLNAFQEKYKIPRGELVLLQMQTSWVSVGDEQRCLTGQGIHTDGADRALLVVLNRRNIDGARNAIYRDIQGKDAVVEPFVLEEGDGLFWKDNQVFHHVEPAQVKDTAVHDPSYPQEGGCGRRTVIIIHYPAMHYITGEPNPNNLLMANISQQEPALGNSKAKVSLRNLVLGDRTDDTESTKDTLGEVDLVYPSVSSIELPKRSTRNKAVYKDSVPEVDEDPRRFFYFI